MLLGPDDDLGFRPQRILINGASGSGKTTLGRSLGGQLGLPYTEIDGLFHGEGWVPRESFLDDVRELVASRAWITDWQYSEARAMLLERCELIVWLDYPRSRTMSRAIRRTLRRRFRREELWNGNREGPLRHFFTDPEHIVRWAWSSYPKVAQRVDAVLRDRPELPVVRLRDDGDIARWRERLG
ncbi:AAA family ATPase [Nocardioides marmorisolisilvae]|uniref:AAA family ATPase n=1 Tax=Nocardioides marmorisolisilvae TaxID=1542737 RepID=A0A3N0DVL7_9ACTN|nr:AAA family ATPase [Nocardioides marmorisolisilvae]RNL79670.1 AAA family ATPase [Nocardioides marmorisolisilvae]